MASSGLISYFIAIIVSIPASYFLLRRSHEKAERNALKETEKALKEMGLSLDKIKEIYKELVIDLSHDSNLKRRKAESQANIEQASSVHAGPQIFKNDNHKSKSSKVMLEAELEQALTASIQAPIEELDKKEVEEKIKAKKAEEEKKKAQRLHIETQIKAALEKLKNSQSLIAPNITSKQAAEALKELNRQGYISPETLGKLAKPTTPTQDSSTGSRQI